MSEPAKQQSNPFSTGGGGVNFETRVQAAFTVFMLSGRPAPCLPSFPIIKIKLQGHYAGFNTDDFIVFSKQPETGKEARLLAQIKHNISITARDTTFAEVIQSTWNDFNDESFNPNTDALALITGLLSATDINDVRPILEWARHAENEVEFFTKISIANFSSDAKKKKLEAFKIHLKTANGETDVSDKQLWEFLKVFHLIGYDLDTESGSTLSLLHSLIAQYASESAPFLWARIVDAVQMSNQNAGTLTLETLPEDIRTTFNVVKPSFVLPQPSKSIFVDIENLIPELLADMRNDLRNNPLIREFIIMRKCAIYNGNSNNLVFQYYFEEHSCLRSKLRILENHALIHEITYNSTSRFVISEELAAYLIKP